MSNINGTDEDFSALDDLRKDTKTFNEVLYEGAIEAARSRKIKVVTVPVNPEHADPDEARRKVLHGFRVFASKRQPKVMIDSHKEDGKVIVWQEPEPSGNPTEAFGPHDT